MKNIFIFLFLFFCLWQSSKQIWGELQSLFYCTWIALLEFIGASSILWLTDRISKHFTEKKMFYLFSVKYTPGKKTGVLSSKQQDIQNRLKIRSISGGIWWIMKLCWLMLIPKIFFKQRRWKQREHTNVVKKKIKGNPVHLNKAG